MILGRHPADAIVFHIDRAFRHLQGIAGGQPAGAVGFDYLAVDAAGQHVAAKLTRDAAADNRDRWRLPVCGLRETIIGLSTWMVMEKQCLSSGVIMALLFRLLTARGHRASVTGLRETK